MLFSDTHDLLRYLKYICYLLSEIQRFSLHQRILLYSLFSLIKRAVDIHCIFNWLANFLNWTALIGSSELNVTLWYIIHSLLLYNTLTASFVKLNEAIKTENNAKHTHREKALSIKTVVLTKSMNMDSWVFGTSTQLFRRDS